MHRDQNFIYVVADGYKGRTSVEVLPYNENLWTAKMVAGEGGVLCIQFNAEIEGKANFADSVSVGGKRWDAAILGDSSIIVDGVLYDSVSAGEKVVVSGVKFPRLFPSYSFTFTLTK